MDEELLQQFLAESWDNLARLDADLLELEQQPQSKELIDSIFRSFHSIKGTCGFFGLTKIGRLSHTAESLLGALRTRSVTVTSQIISIILTTVDEIRALLCGFEATGAEVEGEIDGLIQQLEEAAQASRSKPEEPSPVFSLTEQAVSETEGIDFKDDFEPDFSSIAEIKSHLSVNTPVPLMDSPPGSHESRSLLAASSGRTIRIHIETLDLLMNLVGELVLTRNQLMQLLRKDSSSPYEPPLNVLNRITSELQEGVMKTRMQPVGTAWSGFPRLVRDLSRMTGKPLHLEMIGGETELDRSILEVIKDPITHMVRNAADHGIERPDVRQAVGKPPVGQIRLKASHEGGHVIISVEDDGGGIDERKVLQKALERGLTTAARADQLTSREILSFLFHPGFSTSETVNEISGRGVGMDVVQKVVEGIGGIVDLSSTWGVGSRVTISLPLTLAIISALIITSGGSRFAIPQLDVIELISLSSHELSRVEYIDQHAIYRMPTGLLPLVDLAGLLELDSAAGPRQTLNIVVVQVEEELLGLIVDEVFDTEEIVVKPLGRLLKEIPLYQGMTILGDGQVVMILDTLGIAQECKIFSGKTSGLIGSGDRETSNLQEAEDPTPLLVVRGYDGTAKGIPLPLISRLEEVDPQRIEVTGDRVLMQYGNDLLPLLPLDCSKAVPQFSNPQPIVVFSDSGQSLGLLVQSIQDIYAQPLEVARKTQRPGVLGTAILQGITTEILDLQSYLLRSNPNWFHQTANRAEWLILIVDGSPFFRELLSNSLKIEGYRVRCAESVEAGLKLLEQGVQIDLVISEIEFAGMDGIELAERIRGLRSVGDLPLIALAARMNEALHTRVIAAGFDRCLTKYQSSEVLEAVDELLRPRSARTGVSA